MKIKFYKMSSSYNMLDKSLDNQTAIELDGTLRDQSDLISPVIMVNSDIRDFNYCYISEFGRYYYIKDIVVYRKGLWVISLGVDVLMTYNTEIKLMQGVVGRVASGNAYAENNVVQDVRKTTSKVNWGYTFSLGSKVLVCEGSN